MFGQYRGKREAGRPEKTNGDPFAEESREPETAGELDDPFRTEETPKEAKPRRKLGARKIALIAVGAVAALALVVVGLWAAFVRAPDVSGNVLPARVDKKEQTDTRQEAETDQEETAAPSGRKEDYYTFLLVGEDTSSGSTDTIMLVSYDVAAQAVNFLSLPRDTMVNVSWDIKRINSVYSAKESSGGGMEGLKTQVSYLTGVTPDFYVMVEWEAVGRVVDALGGVWFDVPFNMNYDDPYQDLHIHQSKGSRLLDGQDAMEVVRWRQNSDGTNYGDTTRVEVQQAFLKAVAAQCLKLENWTKVSDFANILFENVETDIPLNNILWFAQQAMGLDMENIQFFTMPGDLNSYAWSRTYHTNQSYAFADPEGMAELINEHFNPYTREIEEDDLQIMYRNRNGSLGVTNGTLADASAASAPVRTTSSSKGSGSSGSSASTQTGSDQAAEPALPSEGGGETGAGDTGDETVESGGTEPGADAGTSGGTGTDSVDDSGDAAPDTGAGQDTGAETGDPQLPPEPVLPGTETGGETGPAPAEDAGSGDSGDSGEAADDTEPPGWL